MCFPREAARKVLIAAQQSKIKDSIILRREIDAEKYEAAIGGLQMAMKVYKEKDSIIQESFKREIGIMASQRLDMEGQIHTLQKQLKKGRVREILTSIAGILATVGAIFLLVK